MHINPIRDAVRGDGKHDARYNIQTVMACLLNIKVKIFTRLINWSTQPFIV